MNNVINMAEVEVYLRRLCRKYYVYTHVEPTNACNASCAVCPRSSMTRSLEMMSWNTFRQIMRTVLPTPIPMLALVGFGEPTLHPKIVEMINYARQERPNLVIKVTTNGSRINERM